MDDDDLHKDMDLGSGNTAACSHGAAALQNLGACENFNVADRGAQSGVVTAWTRNALPAPLAFFPLANNLQSPTLPSYIGLNEGAIFVGDASFGQALSCDKEGKAHVELPNVPYGLKGGMAINFFMRAAPTIVSDFPVSYIYSHTRGPFNVNASSQVEIYMPTSADALYGKMLSYLFDSTYQPTADGMIILGSGVISGPGTFNVTSTQQGPDDDGVNVSKSALIAVEEGGTLQSTAALPSGSRSLSAGAAAGIAVGVVAGVAILAWLSTCLILRSRRARQERVLQKVRGATVLPKPARGLPSRPSGRPMLSRLSSSPSSQPSQSPPEKAVPLGVIPARQAGTRAFGIATMGGRTDDEIQADRVARLASVDSAYGHREYQEAQTVTPATTDIPLDSVASDSGSAASGSFLL
ncbi:hypothetical protein WJX84_006640 [Apatococcus fuscideae]|uniref:Peptidase A1 domain-containing protein n=1 Tax=Apatococcus fuscideae TaxID=2026836 RepID=A0AAW1SU78_9CHLO